MFDNPLTLLVAFAIVAFLGRYLRHGCAAAASAFAGCMRQPRQPPSDAALRLRGIEPPPVAGTVVAAAASPD